MADDFEFRSFLLQVSKQMSSNDFGQLKYLLKGYVSNAKCEEIKAVCDYFEELERMCLLSPKNFGVLKKALGTIGRQDLVEEIEEKEQYFARLFRDKKGDSLGPKEYDAVCDGITEAAGKLEPLPRSGQNTPELQEKLKLASIENEDKVQLEEITDALGISDMSTAVTDLRKENKEIKKGSDLPLKKDEQPMQSQHPVETRDGGDHEEEVKPSPHMDNAESMEIPLEDAVSSNSSEGAVAAEDHQLESKTTEHVLASVEKTTLSTTDEKEPVEDTVPDCNELEDLNPGKAKIKHNMKETTTGATSLPQLGDDVVTDGEENDKGIMADSKKGEVKTTSEEAKHQGPQHALDPGARPKEPLLKKAKTAGPSAAAEQMATEQADEVSETNPHGTLFVESLHPEMTGSKEPTEGAYSGPSTPTGNISLGDGNESDGLYNSDQDESTESEKPKSPMHGQGQGASTTASKGPLGCHHPPGIFSTPLNQKASGYSGHAGAGNYSFPKLIEGESPMHGQGQGVSATASKGPLGCYHPPGIFSTPLNQKASGYSGHAGAGNYSFPDLIVGESPVDGQGQGASATASKGPLGCHHPPGVFSSKPTNQKASGYSDHAVPDNFSLPELMQIASALGLNAESSASQQPDHQMEILKQLLALQSSLSGAEGFNPFTNPVPQSCSSTSSSHNAPTADSPLRSNCYSKAGYSVVITAGHLCESTSEKGVVVMESGTQFCIVIANNNNYAAEVDITFGGMWLGVWVVEGKQTLSSPLVIEGSSWAPGRLRFFNASDAGKPWPSVDIYGDQPHLNGRIELEFKPEVKIMKVHAKHVRKEELFEISIIESKTATVGDLKQEIRKMWNSDISYLLKGGEVLQEEKTISSYALNENEVIGVLNAKEELKIETSGRDPVIMMVDPRNVSVEAVKHFIAEEIRIQVDEQVLRFKRQDTDVDSETLTQMLLTSKQAPVLKVDKDRTINVKVVLPNRGGDETKVEINWSATVEDLKEKLEERDICDTSATLKLGDQEISGQGSKKLIDLGFKNKSEITVSHWAKKSTSRGFSTGAFDGFRGPNLRGFGGFRGFDDCISSPSALRGFPSGTHTLRSGPEDVEYAEDDSSEYHGEEGFAMLHGTEENVHKNFEIDKSGQKFLKEKAVTLVIQLKAKSMGATGAAAAASSQSSVPPGAYYSGGAPGPMSTPTPPPVPD